eukprot:2607085-Prymnesium_polylepis.1
MDMKSSGPSWMPPLAAISGLRHPHTVGGDASLICGCEWTHRLHATESVHARGVELKAAGCAD